MQYSLKLLRQAVSLLLKPQLILEHGGRVALQLLILPAPHILSCHGSVHFTCLSLASTCRKKKVVAHWNQGYAKYHIPATGYSDYIELRVTCLTCSQIGYTW